MIKVGDKVKVMCIESYSDLINGNIYDAIKESYNSYSVSINIFKSIHLDESYLIPYDKWLSIYRESQIKSILDE